MEHAAGERVPIRNVDHEQAHVASGLRLTLSSCRHQAFLQGDLSLALRHWERPTKDHARALQAASHPPFTGWLVLIGIFDSQYNHI